MLSVTDPCELKPADVYRQARLVASKTSRGSDGNWYRAPEEMPWQWHLWFDGGREVHSATFSRHDGQWRQGPELPLACLTTAEGVQEHLAQCLSADHFGQKPKALGVVLHVADEFALAEIAQTFAQEAGEDFQMLRYNLVDEPREVLADRDVSDEANSWRLLPFWGGMAGQSRCVAIALSRSREAFLMKLLAAGEDLRIPVRVAVTSAPLEVLTALPLLRPDLNGGCLLAVPGVKFTSVFALSPEGELRTARSLLHRGGARVPAGFGDILWNMAVSAELVGTDAAGDGKPRILLLSPNPETLRETVQELEMYSTTRHALQLESVDPSAHPLLASVPGWHPELLLYDPASAERLRAAPLARSETFRSLWGGWAIQSFFDTAKLDARYPKLADLRLLRLSTWVMGLLSLVLVSTVVYGSYVLFTAMKHPSWTLTPAQMAEAKARHEKLLTESKQIGLTERLLQPRSRGWVALEFLLQLFPEDSGVRLENFSHTIDPEKAQPVSGKAVAAESVGLVRTWSFKGLVKAKGLELLSNFNSQRGLSALFERVAKVTGDASYQPDSSRLLTVTLTQGRNGRFDPQASPSDAARDPSLLYPFSFEATVTQTLTGKDALAMPVEKPF